LEIDSGSDMEMDSGSDMEMDSGTSEMEMDSVFQSECEAARAQPRANYKKPTVEKPSNLIVVLDLDECLVHAVRSDDTRQLLDASFQLTVQGKVCTFNVRPQLDLFLLDMAAKYELHIFTASTRAYADAVLDHLSHKLGDADLFAGRWYREHCVHNEDKGTYVKDLSRLPLPLDRTVLVDNNPDSFVTSGILVNSFEDDGGDRTLGLVTDFMADRLESADVDVQTVIGQHLPPPGPNTMLLSRGGPAMVVMVAAAVQAGTKWQARATEEDAAATTDAAAATTDGSAPALLET
jgi:Dullard-like phosphatase family protein